ncbi:MAG: DUF3566 domain-containing protein [Verrucomicrobiota bacterium]
MKLQLKRIDPIAAGKVLGALYAALTLLLVPFFLLMGAFASLAAHSTVNMSVESSGPGLGPMLPGLGIFAGMGLFFALMIPVAYGVMGFVVGALLALVYNLICRWVGGLVLEFTAMDGRDHGGRAGGASSVVATADLPPDLPRG